MSRVERDDLPFEVQNHNNQVYLVILMTRTQDWWPIIELTKLYLSKFSNKINNAGKLVAIIFRPWPTSRLAAEKSRANLVQCWSECKQQSSSLIVQLVMPVVTLFKLFRSKEFIPYALSQFNPFQILQNKGFSLTPYPVSERIISRLHISLNSIFEKVLKNLWSKKKCFLDFQRRSFLYLKIFWMHKSWSFVSWIQKSLDFYLTWKIINLKTQNDDIHFWFIGHLSQLLLFFDHCLRKILRTNHSTLNKLTRDYGSKSNLRTSLLQVGLE